MMNPDFCITLLKKQKQYNINDRSPCCAEGGKILGSYNEEARRERKIVKSTEYCMIYTHPKYREYGQKFFKGVDERYTEYAKSLEGKLGIPHGN